MKKTTIGIILVSAGMLGCPPGSSLPGGGGSSGGGEISSQCSGDFGTSGEAQKLEAFLLATSKFVGSAADLEEGLMNACRDMARELQIPDGELAGTAGEPPVKAACRAVAAKIQSEMSDLRAQGQLTVKVVATPPRCEVRLDAYAQCAGECDATIDPGAVDVQCEGGEIVGSCSAQCQGSCSVEASGRCSGACEGTCSGSCTGTCQGGCEGRCSATGADGQCNGRCEGTCHGTCTAGCTGSCEGQCVVQAQASCQGECRGGCSVEYTEPRCTGEVRPPRMEAECQASCDARVNADAQCTPGETTVTIDGSVSSNLEERVARLRAAIQGGFGVMRSTAEKLRRLGETGGAMVRTAEQLPGAVGSLGLRAGACVTEAAAALPRATASVSVSVEVSASVSASAGAG